ncbi:hypothetical protein ACFLSK_01085 [Chloroflexota bacterium]
MRSMEKRIEKLEKSASTRKKPGFVIVVCKPGEDETEKKKVAIAEYLATHPEYSENDIGLVIIVASEESKQVVSRLKEGTRKLNK